ncbi:MAG: (d)CMP kinase [Deltaproteobacteria bacterium]|nr:(d)CMP kinase [Deltaproteobacteria bacterium]
MNGLITVDGPAGSGKSTISRMLSKKINYIYLDTGAMYRAVALLALRTGIDSGDSRGLEIICMSIDLHFETDFEPPRLYLGKEDISMAIRSPEMDMLSSRVSAIKEVREKMTWLQRKIAGGGDLIAEGRDMGTVVFPEAKYKFFLTASLDVRAKRRYKERIDRGESVSLPLVREELRKRDLQDKTRALAPLRPAKDARIIDSTTLIPEQVIQKILSVMERT